MRVSIPTWTTFEAQIEPIVAEAAFESVAPRLGALPSRRLAVVRGDLQFAAAFALDVARRAAEPRVRVRFERLAATGEIPATCVADLPDAALAAWHVRHRFLLSNTLGAAAQLPVAMIDEALAVRARLLDIVGRALIGVPDEAEEIEAIEETTGCEELAADLLVLRSISERHNALLARVDRRYSPADMVRAGELGEEVLEHLIHAASPDARRWLALQPRAWTLLLRTYEEVRRAGRFLFAGEDGESAFPPLTSAARGAACSRWP